MYDKRNVHGYESVQQHQFSIGCDNLRLAFCVDSLLLLLEALRKKYGRCEISFCGKVYELLG